MTHTGGLDGKDCAFCKQLLKCPEVVEENKIPVSQKNSLVFQDNTLRTIYDGNAWMYEAGRWLPYHPEMHMKDMINFLLSYTKYNDSQSTYIDIRSRYDLEEGLEFYFLKKDKLLPHVRVSIFVKNPDLLKLTK